MLSGLRDAAAATRLFRKALTDPSHPQHRPPISTNSREGRDWKSVVVCMATTVPGFSRFVQLPYPQHIRGHADRQEEHHGQELQAES